jgi:hypothetical protein
MCGTVRMFSKTDVPVVTLVVVARGKVAGPIRPLVEGLAWVIDRMAGRSMSRLSVVDNFPSIISWNVAPWRFSSISGHFSEGGASALSEGEEEVRSQ